MNKATLLQAVEAALAGDWEKSHNIAQAYSDDVVNANIANWLHAVLHKIEGDELNSQYWYARTAGIHLSAKNYADFADANAEFKAIMQHLI